MWILSNILIGSNITYSALFLLGTGLLQVLSVIVYSEQQPEDFYIRIDNGKGSMMRLTYDMMYWATLFIGEITDQYDIIPYKDLNVYHNSFIVVICWGGSCSFLSENIYDSAKVIVRLAITIPSPLKSLSLLHFGVKNQGTQQKHSKTGWE